MTTKTPTFDEQMVALADAGRFPVKRMATSPLGGTDNRTVLYRMNAAGRKLLFSETLNGSMRPVSATRLAGHLTDCGVTIVAADALTMSAMSRVLASFTGPDTRRYTFILSVLAAAQPNTGVVNLTSLLGRLWAAPTGTAPSVDGWCRAFRLPAGDLGGLLSRVTFGEGFKELDKSTDNIRYLSDPTVAVSARMQHKGFESSSALVDRWGEMQRKDEILCRRFTEKGDVVTATLTAAPASGASSAQVKLSLPCKVKEGQVLVSRGTSRTTADLTHLRFDDQDGLTCTLRKVGRRTKSVVQMLSDPAMSGPVYVTTPAFNSSGGPTGTRWLRGGERDRLGKLEMPLDLLVAGAPQGD